MSRLSALLTCALGASLLNAARADDSDGWVQLFNGKDLTGWKMVPNPGNGITDLTEKKVDGKVVAHAGNGITDLTEKKVDETVVAYEGTVRGKKIPLCRVLDGTIIGGGPS